ncbi:hypothetical protein SARC_11196 [Sphaeroforma arctica JP610]|uniref:Uncharacterized protein n=1 Tax=Sphaeroforma arctica JP610 TaxID=667725 RepID=A0A0L0FII5_9EUKA|nr:hypothetical protein SARC_11196 [Sphaeroforma arctica JP610]KNC76296.1 hypothetical protein SARC_11196 [Sphaeroforma arctica JP610]|eukprot:XP_014150198.1 hypothetical protein SARC_11196 [Sphaeroforma arctica JP610]
MKSYPSTPDGNSQAHRDPPRRLEFSESDDGDQGPNDSTFTPTPTPQHHRTPTTTGTAGMHYYHSVHGQQAHLNAPIRRVRPGNLHTHASQDTRGDASFSRNRTDAHEVNDISIFGSDSSVERDDGMSQSEYFDSADDMDSDADRVDDLLNELEQDAGFEYPSLSASSVTEPSLDDLKKQIQKDAWMYDPIDTLLGLK